MTASNDAERLDGDVLGEEVGDDGLPGAGDFPPDQALGVNDPNLIAPDDVAMREARTRSDAFARVPSADKVDLLPPDGDEGHQGREQQAVASVVSDDRATSPAEVGAVRIETEPIDPA